MIRGHSRFSQPKTSTLTQSRSFNPAQLPRKSSSNANNNSEGITPTKYIDEVYRHRQLLEFEVKNIEGKWLRPTIAPNTCVFIAPSATITGNVKIYQRSTIWYNVVLKGDVNSIKIGAYTNIQDGTVIHEALGQIDEEHDGSTVIGHKVTIGHGCMLRACTIEPGCIVGMNSVLEEGSYMEKGSILGANSVLAKGARIPAGQVWAGRPAAYLRDVHAVESTKFEPHAINYNHYGIFHQNEFWLPNDNYKEAQKEGLPLGFIDNSFSRFFWQNLKNEDTHHYSTYH